MSKPVKMEPGVKLRDAENMALIPVKVMPTERDEMLRKPEYFSECYTTGLFKED